MYIISTYMYMYPSLSEIVVVRVYMHMCIYISLSVVPRKSSSSGPTRKRAGSAKLPLSVPVLFPRVTRSSSREKTSAQSSPPLLPSHPHPLPPVTRSSSSKLVSAKSPPAKMPSAKSTDSVAAKKSPGVGAVSKEKQKRFGGQLE